MKNNELNEVKRMAIKTCKGFVRIGSKYKKIVENAKSPHEVINHMVLMLDEIKLLEINEEQEN